MNYRRFILIGVSGAASLMLAVSALADSAPGAQGRPRSSGAIIGSGNSLVKGTRGGLIYAIDLIDDGTTPSTITVYDSKTAVGTDGKQKWEGKTALNNTTYSVVFNPPLVMDEGIYVEVEGPGAVGFISFE